MLSDIAHKVAHRYLLAAFSMDALARLSVLEGIAGVPAGRWLRKGGRGLDLAQGWAAEMGGGLHPYWTGAQNSGLLASAEKAAAGVLKAVSGIDAEDLIQEMIIESTTPGGTKRRQIFYSAGEAIGKDKKKVEQLLEGRLPPSAIAGIPAQMAKRFALSEKKRLRNKMEVSPKDEGAGADIFSQHATVSVDDPNVRQNVLLMSLHSPESFPGGQKIRAIINTTIDRVYSKSEKKAALLKEFFRELAKSKDKYITPTKAQKSQLNKDPDSFYRSVMRSVGSQAAKNLGIPHGRITSEVLGKGKVQDFVEKHLLNNSAIKKVTEEILDSLNFREDFAYGARLAKSKDSASKLRLGPGSYNQSLTDQLQNLKLKT